jgi:hypothetical protein
MGGTSFEISVSDYTSSVEEYRRAETAPKSELPKLSDDQKAVARRFKITEEEYARGVLAGIYGRERQRARGRQLGELTQNMLAELGRSDQVVHVAYEMDKVRWVVSIKASNGIAQVAIPRELASDLLDSGLTEYERELKSRVARALGVAEGTTK